MINGILIDEQCFTHPLVIVNLEGEYPMAFPENSMDIARASDTPLVKIIQQARSKVITNKVIQWYHDIQTNAMYIE